MYGIAKPLPPVKEPVFRYCKKGYFTMQEKIISYIKSKEEEMLAFWRKLVLIESPSYHKEGVDRVGELIADFCHELGYFIRFQEDSIYGNCLAACSCAFEEFNHGIVISAHMDTVHKLGSFDPLLKEDDRYLYGPGAGDCKGGIVMALLVASALKEIGYNARPIKLLFAADEESGGPTGKNFYPRELSGADYMFNAESGISKKLVTGRKASLIAVYNIQGEAAHIGYLSEKPKSAIREAACKLMELEDASDYGNLTFCAGTISGGTAATSVPQECTLQVNVRIKDASYVSKAIDILTRANNPHVEGTKSTLEILGNYIPMKQNEDNDTLCQRMSRISKELGFGPLEPYFVGGASDASYASAMNIPVVCASGPIVDFQHTLNERVLKSSLLQRAIIHTKTIFDL